MLFVSGALQWLRPLFLPSPERHEGPLLSWSEASPEESGGVRTDGVVEMHYSGTHASPVGSPGSAGLSRHFLRGHLRPEGG